MSKPLFSVDPGWLFVLAGLALLVSGALVPIQRDLHDLREQLRVVRDREAESYERLRAYAGFMEDLDNREPTLVKRLAAAQLNLMPKGGTAVLVAESLDAGVNDWIEATVEFEPSSPETLPDTLLTRLATGPRRLWLLAGGAMAVFVGLMLGPGISGPLTRKPRGLLPAATVTTPVVGLLIDESARQAVIDETLDASRFGADSTLDVVDENVVDVAVEPEMPFDEPATIVAEAHAPSETSPDESRQVEPVEHVDPEPVVEPTAESAAEIAGEADDELVDQGVVAWPQASAPAISPLSHVIDAEIVQSDELPQTDHTEDLIDYIEGGPRPATS